MDPQQLLISIVQHLNNFIFAITKISLLFIDRDIHISYVFIN
jgi:hypothetical protein